MSDISAQSTKTSLAVESCVLAGNLIFFALSSIVYFGRQSYKTLLRPYTRYLVKTQAARKLAADIHQKYWLDLLITSLFLDTLLRSFAQLCQVFLYSRKLVTENYDQLDYVDAIAFSVLLTSVTSYTLVFCALIKMWLTLFLSQFEETKRTKLIIFWSIRLTMIASIVSAVIVTITMITLIAIPGLYVTQTSLVLSIFIGTLTLFVVSLGVLCFVVILLGIHIALLIKRASAAAESKITAAKRLALAKVSIAVASFVIALALRAAGIVLLLLSRYIPNWVGTLFLIALPEFTTFGTLIVILWPFKVKCCSRIDVDDLGSSPNEAHGSLEVKKAEEVVNADAQSSQSISKVDSPSEETQTPL